ncbi:hypothetical protein ABIE64_002663 [Thalassospira sp. MBR-102]|jgi:hypothetical protein|uniref:hypothetical protein n=1 Tax=Thalassospira sp. MBR-102 TaxID=3156466 RepID=UPI003397E2CA
MSDQSNDNPVYLMLGRIEGKLDAMHGKSREQDDRLNNHSERIGRLERWKVWLVGLAAGVGAAASQLPELIKGH